MKKNQSDIHGLPDAEVWNLFRHGSEAAFEFIYTKHFDKLYNYGCQFTKDHSLVEDVLQALFIELKRRSQHLSATDKIQPYLYQAFRRKLIRERAKQSRFKALDEQHSFSIVSNVEDFLIEEETKREQQLKVAQGIATLSERHREIIFLFFYENLSYEEIQKIQGFDNIKSARNLLYKALQVLRGKMALLSIVFFGWLSVSPIVQILKKSSEL